MPTHGEKRVMPYTADQMYDLVADVGRYPEFLPWNSAARVRRVVPLEGGRQLMEADLVISFKVFRERFTSRVTLDQTGRRIDTEYLDGPFKYLKSFWIFNDHPQLRGRILRGFRVQKPNAAKGDRPCVQRGNAPDRGGV